MSKYTMELRELFTPIKFNPPLYTKEQVEGFFKVYELSDYLTPSQIQTITTAGIWSKDKLAKKIVNHYYMREIGQETIGLWIHYVKDTMDLLMEEYLPLIYSASISYDPLINVDYTETFSRTVNVDNTGASVSNSTNTADSIGISSNTPQGRVTKASILAGNYATETQGTETSSTIGNKTDTTSGSDSEEEYTKRIKGNSGVSATAQKMIEQYRDNIRAIDREIIEKLEPLFMGLY